MQLTWVSPVSTRMPAIVTKTASKTLNKHHDHSLTEMISWIFMTVNGLDKKKGKEKMSGYPVCLLLLKEKWE